MFANLIYFWLISVERCRNADENQDLESNDAYLVKRDVLLMVDVLIYRLEGTLLSTDQGQAYFKVIWRFTMYRIPRILI